MLIESVLLPRSIDILDGLGMEFKRKSLKEFAFIARTWKNEEHCTLCNESNQEGGAMELMQTMTRGRWVHRGVGVARY